MNVLSYFLLKWLSRIICDWDSTMYVILCPAWLFDTYCWHVSHIIIQYCRIEGFLLSLARYGWLLGQIFYFLEKNAWQWRSSTMKKVVFRKWAGSLEFPTKLQPCSWDQAIEIKVDGYKYTEGQYFTTKWDFREAVCASYFDYLLFK